MSSNQHSVTGDWIDAIVQQYERPLVRYAAQIVGDLERGRDVAQDTFLRLCKQDRDHLDGHLVEWLYTVCRNRALDVRRKESRMKSMTAEQTIVQPSRGTDQADLSEQQDTTARVLEFVDRLSENQREVVRLKFQHGLSYKEIAAVTELSVTNVGYLIHTAIKKLRVELGVTT
ncbi:MAG: sigma-70 family RNA polymerase sigma factor [Planctomycetaceae bacterium]|nr:sigma-70 family RNA polymerase sigma factor [Planctomycetales bacterium]MCB9920570.1 sigma-70 family RNA polymerase sigma factor [Planctomycetaceae bacterium]